MRFAPESLISSTLMGGVDEGWRLDGPQHQFCIFAGTSVTSFIKMS